MKSLSILLPSVALALAMNVHAQTPEDIAAAQQAAQSWLRLADAAQYGDTWDQAAAAFQGAISKPDWEKASRAVRDPLGAVKERRLQDATYSASLPGAPAGEYVVIRYSTAFANKAEATETVTPMRGADGQWRVSGYFIR